MTPKGNAHKSSLSGNWETPEHVVDDLAPLFPWDLDTCASRPNVCENFFDVEKDGLAQPWHGLCYCNMPYGKKRHIDLWMQKARLEGQRSETTVVCLPPARTSTKWWHDNAPLASLVVFVKGRFKFFLPAHWETDEKTNKEIWVPDKTGPAGFPSAWVVFGDNLTHPQVDKLCSYGWSISPRRQFENHNMIDAWNDATTVAAATVAQFTGNPQVDVIEKRVLRNLLPHSACVHKMKGTQ